MKQASYSTTTQNQCKRNQYFSLIVINTFYKAETCIAQH